MSTLTHYIIAGRNYWGRGETPEAAKAQYKLAGGRRTDFKHCVWFKCTPKTRIDDMGGLTRPVNDEPAVELTGKDRPNNK